MMMVLLLLMSVMMKPSEIKQFVFVIMMKTNCFIKDGIFSHDYVQNSTISCRQLQANRYTRWIFTEPDATVSLY